MAFDSSYRGGPIRSLTMLYLAWPSQLYQIQVTKALNYVKEAGFGYEKIVNNFDAIRGATNLHVY